MDKLHQTLVTLEQSMNIDWVRGIIECHILWMVSSFGNIPAVCIVAVLIVLSHIFYSTTNMENPNDKK